MSEGAMAHAAAFALAYASSNVDNLLVLTVLYADRSLAPRQAIAGTFLGFVVINAIALSAARLAASVPLPLLGVLGLIPLGLGLRALVLRTRRAPASASTRPLTLWGGPTLFVAVTMLANGADNVSLFVPLWARLPLAAAAGFALLSSALSPGLAWLARGLSHHLRLEHVVRALGALSMPALFMGIGFYVFVSNGTWGWLRDRLLEHPTLGAR
jgi:cadmium resistance protein CadD (predicted permease)